MTPNQYAAINVFSQELSMTDAELALLEFLNVQVLLDDQAQNMSNPKTFIFAPFCPADVEIVAQPKQHQPGLFIGIKLDGMIQREDDFHISRARA